jgi:hypothetical protein
MKEYTKEFYRLNIRVGHREGDEEKVSRYRNGLRYEIQDEISMMTIRTIEDSYQVALKAEDKLARKQSHRSRGKCPQRGKGIVHEKSQKPKTVTEKSHSHIERGGSSRGRQYGGRNCFHRGRIRGIGGEVRRYDCGKTRHMSWECPERNKEGGGEDHISEAHKKNVEAEATEDGKSLMMRKVLLKPKKEVEKEPMQRKNLFKTAWKTKDRVFKVIIDSWITDNVVSIEMVEKLELETSAHPNPYKVL